MYNKLCKNTLWEELYGNNFSFKITQKKRAAIAYNKAVDLAKAFGMNKNFPTNYIEDLTAKEYADIYVKIKISTKYLNYLKFGCR